MKTLSLSPPLPKHWHDVKLAQSRVTTKVSDLPGHPWKAAEIPQRMQRRRRDVCDKLWLHGG